MSDATSNFQTSKLGSKGQTCKEAALYGMPAAESFTHVESVPGSAPPSFMESAMTTPSLRDTEYICFAEMRAVMRSFDTREVLIHTHVSQWPSGRLVCIDDNECKACA